MIKHIFNTLSRRPFDLRATGQGHTIEWPIDGQTLFIHCATHPLRWSQEGLANALLVQAMRFQRGLSLQNADATWLAQNAKLQTIIEGWWGYPSTPIHNTASAQTAAPALPPQRKKALAFSLGVDSFYSLFFSPIQPETLIMVAGFDVRHDNSPVIQAMQQSLQDISQATGTEAILLKTNLRRLHAFRRAAWIKTHGGALSLMAHCLNQHIDTLLISSSAPAEELSPCGTHPDIDPLWSTQALQVQHIGIEASRLEKIKKIIEHPIARPLFKKHVRVCFTRPSESGNCGECPKCIALKLSLLKLGAGFVPDTMPDKQPLDQLIEASPPVPDRVSLPHREELLGLEDKKINDALIRYIQRSKELIHAKEQQNRK